MSIQTETQSNTNVETRQHRINKQNVRRTKKIDFKGSKRSIRSIADEYGIKYSNVADRHRRGLKDDELIYGKKKEPKTYRQTIMFKGEEVPLVELAKEHGIDKGTILYRYEQGRRDDDLLTRERTNKATIEYKGEQVFLEELADKLNVGRRTLRERYNRGLRDDELAAPPKNQGANTVFFIDDEPFKLTPKQSNIKARKKLSSKEIQERLNIGFTVNEALAFSNRYVVKFKELCYMLEGEGMFYYIPHYSLAELKERGVSLHLMSVRIKNCEDIHDTLDDPSLMDGVKIYEEDMNFDSTLDAELEQRKREERIQYYKDKKYKEEHPHLFDGTPQKHSEGKYAKYLFDSYTFACNDVKDDK